jgi:CDP-diacylglycerol--glycerol-3-phosphate 3-phosphatidyltransferase
MALARGKTAFGSSTMQRSAVSRFLTGSRFVRSLYGVAKVAAFVLLGTEVAVERALADGVEVITAEGLSLLGGVAQVSVWVAVVLCVVRGIPVLLDGRTYLMGDPDPEGSAA